ncbi:MAG: DNA primase [Candidatus Nanopelagicales bacterium]|nr:DNA primase [Candidatus Nanopelagicales bacterium]
MKGRIRAEDIAEVRDRVRIDEVVSEHVTLRNAGGGSMKGLCPFHEERTPSFHVTASKGLYHCFGCGTGGDVVDFLMAVDHLAFAEAVEKLAGRVGLVLRYEGGSAAGQTGTPRSRLVAVNAATNRFFQGKLSDRDASVARQLLSDRGFPDEAWGRFGLGYAPRQGLVAHLRSEFSDSEIVESGVAGRGDRGLYDRFRDRLVWPIRDVSGDVVGFGARRLGDDGPKYLNTSETPLYKKSQVLYGLFEAKKAIARSQRVVVVEGYTDVMACQLAGVDTAVATCGTAFGSGHVKILRRLLMDDSRAEVVFTFDGDEAGQAAAQKAYAEDQSFAAKMLVAVAAEGLDPCDLRLTHGDEAVRDLIEHRVPLFEFVLRRTLTGLDLGSAEGRAAGLRAVAPVIGGIKDEMLRPEYAREVAGWLGVEPERVLAAVRSSARGRDTDREAGRDQRSYGSHGSLSNSVSEWTDARVEREALKLLLQFPDLVGDWRVSVTPSCFTSDTPKALLAAIQSADEGGDLTEAQRVRSVLESCADDGERALVRALSTEAVAGVSERYAVGIMANLLERSVARDVADLRSELDDPERTSQVLGDLLRLEQYRRELRRHWAGVD